MNLRATSLPRTAVVPKVHGIKGPFWDSFIDSGKRHSSMPVCEWQQPDLKSTRGSYRRASAEADIESIGLTAWCP